MAKETIVYINDSGDVYLINSNVWSAMPEAISDKRH
jgi:hypothetical protein